MPDLIRRLQPRLPALHDKVIFARKRPGAVRSTALPSISDIIVEAVADGEERSDGRYCQVQ